MQGQVIEVRQHKEGIQDPGAGCVRESHVEAGERGGLGEEGYDRGLVGLGDGEGFEAWCDVAEVRCGWPAQVGKTDAGCGGLWPAAEGTQGELAVGFPVRIGFEVVAGAGPAEVEGGVGGGVGVEGSGEERLGEVAEL